MRIWLALIVLELLIVCNSTAIVIDKDKNATDKTSTHSVKVQPLLSERSSLKKQIIDFENRQDFWNGWYLRLGAGAVILALLLGAASWIAQKQASDNSYRIRPLAARVGEIDVLLHDAERREAEAAVTSAHTLAAQADEGAARAKERAEQTHSDNIELQAVLSQETARAQESAALLKQQNLQTERKLESERERRLALEARIAPRRLDGQEKIKLVNSLKPLTSVLLHPELKGRCPRIRVTSVMNDAESGEYAFAILGALREANWKVEGVNEAAFNVPGPRGLVLQISPADRNDLFLQRLREAFSTINVWIAGEIIPNNGRLMESGSAELIVGFKPQPDIK